MTDQSAKSLRWLANQFPAVESPKDDTDRMQTCIHLYCAAGADAIETLTAQLSALQAEIAQQNNSNEVLRAERDDLHINNCKLRSALSHVEAERDAAVKDLKEIAEDTGDGCQYCKHLPCAQKYGRCIGFVWRGAQGEG